jgi:hypothetical protein
MFTALSPRTGLFHSMLLHRMARRGFILPHQTTEKVSQAKVNIASK